MNTPLQHEAYEQLKFTPYRFVLFIWLILR